MNKRVILILSGNEEVCGIEEYAKKVSARVITAEEFYVSDKDSMLEYDQILIINSCISILPHAPDIFSETPLNKVGAIPLGNFVQQSTKYSPSVLVVPQKLYNINTLFSFDEYGDRVHSLSYKFNRIPELDAKTGEHRLSSYFLNYSPLLDGMPKDAVLSIMKKDIEDYNNDNYYKGYNIAVRVGGGYGDLVAAEPTVRYICEDLYKNDTVIIMTYAPELFEHINRPKYKLDSMIPDASSYYIIDTFPSQDHISKFIISPLLVHACTYASISAIRSELPLNKRQIKLPLRWDSEAFAVLKLGRQDYQNMVLLHMGISWSSKTIPEDVWQSYIDKIIKMGKTPVLIGKDMDFRGVAKNIKTNGCVDLRNNLEIAELVAVVSKIPILISNDSFPVHIAGAFDNYIGLIATCKSANFILPHRDNGNIYHKAKDLSKFEFYKKYEARPNYIEGSRVDEIIDRDYFNACLPSPEDIEKFILECSITYSKEELEKRRITIEPIEGDL